MRFRRSYIDGVASWGCNVGDGTHGTRVEHDLVVIDKGVLVYASEDVATTDMVTDLAQRCLVKRFRWYIGSAPCRWYA